MKEATVEGQLKWLEGFGFLVLKLRTPAYNGVMDRMILWPTWSPHPPTLVELKAPDKKPRKLQNAVAADWVLRGVDVRAYIDTVDRAKTFCDGLLWNALMDVPVDERVKLPLHVREEYHRMFNERNSRWLQGA